MSYVIGSYVMSYIYAIAAAVHECVAGSSTKSCYISVISVIVFYSFYGFIA